LNVPLASAPPLPEVAPIMVCVIDGEVVQSSVAVAIRPLTLAEHSPARLDVTTLLGQTMSGFSVSVQALPKSFECPNP
jgi:hypothetical protein